MRVFRANRDEFRETLMQRAGLTPELVRSIVFGHANEAEQREYAEAKVRMIAVRQELLEKEGFVFHNGEPVRPWDTYIDFNANEFVFTQGEFRSKWLQ